MTPVIRQHKKNPVEKAVDAITSAVLGKAPAKCPEMEQFYGGKCLGELNGFQRQKAEECLQQRITAQKLGIDWRKACGGSGGGGSGGGGGGNTNPVSLVILPDNPAPEPENPSQPPEVPIPPETPKAPKKDTAFGIEKEKLGMFLRKKLELAQQNCVGCAETIIDVLPEKLAKIKPTIDTAKTADYETLKEENKITDDFSETSGKTTTILIEAQTQEEILETAANVKALGGEVKFAGAIGNVIVAEIPENKAIKLAATEQVKMISKDREVQMLLNEAIQQINANFESVAPFTGNGVRVAVVDTGIDSANPMLSGKVVSQADFTGEGTQDLQGHGTHIAGIIAGTTQNNGTLNGAAPNALLINAKALNSNGSGTISQIIQAINYSLNPDGDIYTDDGARIINLSLGAIGDFSDSPLENTLAEAEAAGAFVVASAGNCGYEQPSGSCNGYAGLTYPGSSAHAFTVGAADENNNIAGFSSRGFVQDYGIKPDVVAPGTNITSAGLNGATITQSGTSMSAAFVSGTAALLIEKNPLLSPQQIKELLAKTSTDLGLEGKDSLYGFGLLDAKKALKDIDLVRSKTMAISNNPTVATIGIDDNRFEAILRIYNGSGKTIRIRDYVADQWLHLGYPAEIPAGMSSPLIHQSNVIFRFE